MLEIKLADVGGKVRILNLSGEMIAEGFVSSLRLEDDKPSKGNRYGEYGDVNIRIVVTAKPTKCSAVLLGVQCDLRQGHPLWHSAKVGGCDMKWDEN